MSQVLPPRQIIIREPSNSLGLAGFICSLVGIFSCGLLSPIGAVLSFFGLFRPPRALAIAGFIIGLAGSVWVIIAVFVIGVGAVLAALGWNQFETTVQMAKIGGAVEQYRSTNGVLPPSLDALPQTSELKLTDPWGRPYRYHPDPATNGFTLSSDGPDGTPGTADDPVAYNAYAEWKVTAPKQ